MSEFTARFLADYLPPDFTISTIELTVELDETKTLVTSKMEIAKQNQAQKHLVLDGEHLTLKSVSLNNSLLSPEQYQLADNNLMVLNVPDEFSLTVVTEINPSGNTALEGLYKSGQAYCTQCEAEGFRRITYYLDRPDVMAIFTTTVIADKNDFPYLLANGNPIAKGDTKDGKHFVTWHDPFPKPCYLFALVAGDFDLLADTYTTASGREVALEIFVDKGNKSKAEHAMTSLKHSMKWDEDVFGLEYDLDIYMIVAVDFFNMGAMENKGLNVFNSKYVLADSDTATDTDFFNVEAVIAHEYFHNWTGNRVTCRDWFQLSLKEGLTVFRDQQFSADMHSAGVTRIQNVKVLRSQQFAEDAGPMSHPIRPEKVMEMNNFYTLTVYEKGSEVIRMLHTLLGKNGFRKGMDLYFKRFDGMAVTCDDFVNAMAGANNKDLSLFKNWYCQSGTPELTVIQDYDSVNKVLSLKVSQHTPASANQQEKKPLHIPINIEIIELDGDTHQQHTLELTAAEQTWTFDCNVKPVVAFLGDFSAPVKVHFAQSDQELLAVIAHSKDSFCIWNAAQTIMANEVKRLVDSADKQPSALITQMFSAILAANYDAAFKSLMLTLPSFDELASDIEKVNPQLLIQALEKIKRLVAEHFEHELSSLFNTLSNADELSVSEQVGARALASTCLAYLGYNKKHHALIDRYYTQASNMTTRLGALQAAVKHNSELADTLLAKLESKFAGDNLVMDKWFSLNANVGDSSIFERLSKLMNRDDFSLNNPNRARALIGAFAMQNAKYFHCPTGKGYEFLTEQIIALDKINPQVASRLITPLIQYKAFDDNHQQMMKRCLQQIARQDSLSRDLVEKLEAALNS